MEFSERVKDVALDTKARPRTLVDKSLKSVLSS